MTRATSKFKKFIIDGHKEKLKQFEGEHSEFFKEISRIEKAISDNKGEQDAKNREKENLKKFKKDEANKNSAKELDNVNRYKFSLKPETIDAVNYISQTIIQDLVNASYNLCKEAQPDKNFKIEPQIFKSISPADISTYPLIYNLPAFKALIDYEPPVKQTKAETSENSDTSDQEETVKKVRTAESLKPSIEAVLKARNTEEGFPRVLEGGKKEVRPTIRPVSINLISDIVIDFIKSLYNGISVIVGDLGKNSTTTKNHILGIIKLLYYHYHNNFDKFDVLNKGLDEYLKVREEQKKNKTKPAEGEAKEKPAPKKAATPATKPTPKKVATPAGAAAAPAPPPKAAAKKAPAPPPKKR